MRHAGGGLRQQFHLPHILEGAGQCTGLRRTPKTPNSVSCWRPAFGGCACQRYLHQKEIKSCSFYAAFLQRFKLFSAPCYQNPPTLLKRAPSHEIEIAPVESGGKILQHHHHIIGIDARAASNPIRAEIGDNRVFYSGVIAVCVSIVLAQT